MRAASFALILFAAAVHPSPAAIRTVVAATDSKTVYFTTSNTRFVITEAGKLNLAPVMPDDLTPSGAIGTASYHATRYCGSPGSTCFLAAPCRAGFNVYDMRQAPESPLLSSHSRSSFTRFDPTGTYLWVEQSDPADCAALSPRPDPARNGLYTLDGATRIAERGAGILANRRPGRRAVANGPRALTLLDGQLRWLARDGVTTPVPTATKVQEAVTDNSGRTIVYVEAETGRLGWIESSPFQPETHTDLGVVGTAPALSPDGRTLAFLSADGALTVYDRPSRSLHRLGDATAFAISEAALFVGTSDNRVDRIDLQTGARTTLAEHIPEITRVVAPATSGYFICPLPCYGSDSGYMLSPGMLLQVEGVHLDAPGWKLSVAGRTPVEPLSVSPTRLMFQIPSDAPTAIAETASIYSPDAPSNLAIKVAVTASALVCLGTLHEDFSGPVNTDSPARPGEVIHTFVTGLRPAEPIPARQPNPSDRLISVTNPPSLDAALSGWEIIFSGLAPGLIGTQQLEIRTGQPSAPDAPLFENSTDSRCLAPPVKLN